MRINVNNIEREKERFYSFPTNESNIRNDYVSTIIKTQTGYFTFISSGLLTVLAAISSYNSRQLDKPPPLLVRKKKTFKGNNQYTVDIFQQLQPTISSQIFFWSSREQ